MKFPKIELPRFERKIKEPDPPGVTVPEWLVRATKFAAWVATFALIYFLWLYTLDVARDRAEPLHLTHLGSWTGEIFFWFPHIIGFAIVAVGIPYVAKISIPTFVSLSWRQDPTAKAWSLLIAIAVSLVVISGTFAVQGHTIMERDRDAAVAVEGVQQEAAVLASRIADKRQELDDMVTNASAYIRTAASMSPDAYDAFVAQRRDDWQYDRLLSYRATSVDAQRLRNEIRDLRDQQARQTSVASVQREVVTESTGWIASTLGWLEGVRAILLSFVMDIVALIMPLIALRLEQARNRQLGLVNSVEASGWAPEGLRIEDLRAQDPIAKNTVQMETQVRATNNETGEEEILIKPKPYWRKAKRGQPTPVMVTPDIPDDETGVTIDGGNRIAVGADGLGGVMESVDPSVGIEPEAPAAEIQAGMQEQTNVGDREQEQEPQQINLNDHPEPSQMSEEDLAVLYSTDSFEQSDERGAENDSAEQESDYDHNQPRETNPARLLAAE
jgi:hypothetical protein